MSDKPGYAQAARRLFRDAQLPKGQRRFDTAGYLFGLAAECGVKVVLEQLLRGRKIPTSRDQGHFPGLRGAALKVLQGRQGAALATVLSRKDLLVSWHIGLRYSADMTVSESDCQTWERDAQKCISMIIKP